MNERELRVLRSIVDSLRAIQRDVHAIYEQRSANENQQEPPTQVDVKAEVGLPVPIKDYYESEQRDRPDNTRRDRMRLWFEGIALGAAIVAAIFTFCTIGEVRRQADAAQNQVGIMQAQLDAADRAWIKVSLSPSNPITYTESGDVQLSASVAMENVGRSVAVSNVVKVKFLAPKGTEMLTELVAQQSKLCGVPPISLIKDSDIEPIKTTVFIGGTGHLGIGNNLVRADIEAASFPPNGPLKNRFFVPVVVGCVDYKYGGSPKHHQTGFIYQIMRVDNPSQPLAIEIGSTLPAARIYFQPNLFGGVYAY